MWGELQRIHEGEAGEASVDPGWVTVDVALTQPDENQNSKPVFLNTEHTGFPPWETQLLRHVTHNPETRACHD